MPRHSNPRTTRKTLPDPPTHGIRIDRRFALRLRVAGPVLLAIDVTDSQPTRGVPRASRGQPR